MKLNGPSSILQRKKLKLRPQKQLVRVKILPPGWLMISKGPRLDGPSQQRGMNLEEHSPSLALNILIPNEECNRGPAASEGRVTGGWERAPKGLKSKAKYHCQFRG